MVRKVEDSIRAGRAMDEPGADPSRNSLQTVTLLDALAEFRCDAAIGGARRDEEKARAKERFFSHRDEFGQWDPKQQRQELWNLFDGYKRNRATGGLVLIDEFTNCTLAAGMILETGATAPGETFPDMGGL
jgi:3'-phosphoadenosine 5'-phosphosulfate sulfotransferase (PAPS reductase)/FAD synthetase